LRNQALAAGHNGIVITDPNQPDNPVVYANPAFERITGYSIEETVGKNCRFLQGDDRDQPALEKLRATLREGRECQVVLRNYQKDGTLFWNELSISPVHDEEGNLANFVGVLHNVTKRDQTEEALQYQSDLTKTIVNNAADSLFLWDAEGRVTLMNPAAEQTFGWRQEELLGEVLHNRIHQHHLDGRPYPISECPLVRVFESGRTIRDHEDVFFRRDGSPIDVACSHSPIIVDGKITGAALVVRDITERKQIEEASKQSERLYRMLIEQATENIFLVDAETRRIVEFNPAFQKTLGYAEKELRSITLYDIVAADWKSIDLNIRRILEQKSSFVGERKYRRKDASLVDVEVSASTILRNDRETLCFIAHDITERKKNEEKQRFLTEASVSLSSSLDYRTTLASMARLAVPYLADWCVVDILEENGSLGRLAVTHQVLRTGRPELVAEISESLLDGVIRDAEHREILRRLGLKSYIIVPLVARGRALGAITLVSAESGRRYGQAELELAEDLARRAALAVDNARLYRSRTQVVRTLQEGLLPSRLPEVPGVEVGLRYLSSGEVDVGGDFYDLFDARTANHNGSSEPPSSAWGVVIGDVSGKGAEAAAVLALARYTIRAVAARESDPSAVLACLNEAILRQRRERDDCRFCTVTYARLETNEQSTEHGVKVTVCRGGHPVPFLLKADGKISRVGQPGCAIGVCDDANLSDQETRLAPGDALILYTDGVVEARSPEGIFFGEERLIALLRSSVALDAPVMASRIERAVLNFQGQAPRDDIAVLVLRVSD
jgi:PAS domain S-box-containing protein